MSSSGITSVGGILKIATIIVGVIAIGLTADCYFKNVSQEEYYLAILIIAVIVSIVMLILTMFVKVFPNAAQSKLVDMGIHAVLAGLVGLGAILMASQTHKYRFIKDFPHNQKSIYIERIIASTLGFVLTLLYGFTCLLLLRSQPS